MADSEGTWTVRRLLEWTTSFFTRKGMDQSRLCAELLLAHVLQSKRIKLYTDYERVVEPKQLAQYRDLVKRAAEEEPVAYLTGQAHFFSLEFEVNKDVLIPRPDTETLVENVIQLIRHEPGMETPRILDLCTGSGCIAAALAHNLKTASVIATDNSAAALEVAKRNIEKLGLSDRVSLKQGDLFVPVDHQPFNVIVSNPPYIPTNQIQSLDKSVKDFEPLAALDGGLDGLTFHRRILAQAPGRLTSNGQIFLEIAFDQGDLAKSVIAQHKEFTNARILKDNAGNDRVLAREERKTNMRRTLFILVALIIAIGVTIRIHRNTAPAAHFTVAQLSNYDLDQFSGTEADVPQWIRNLAGKKIEIDGEMWAPQYIADGDAITSFQLVDRKHYNERTPPVAQGFINATISQGKRISYSDDTVRVLGTLHIHIVRLHPAEMISTVLQIDAENVLPMDAPTPADSFIEFNVGWVPGVIAITAFLAVATWLSISHVRHRQFLRRLQAVFPSVV